MSTEPEGGETEWDEHGAPVEPFRDGKVHVMKERCTTCVFHPGNRMNLRPGRLKDMVEQTDDSAACLGPDHRRALFSCHQTLPYAESEYVEHYGGAALCHGAVENYGHDSMTMRMAHAMGVIEEVEPYPGSDSLHEHSDPTTPAHGSPR